LTSRYDLNNVDQCYIFNIQCACKGLIQDVLLFYHLIVKTLYTAFKVYSIKYFSFFYIEEKLEKDIKEYLSHFYIEKH
jgi:hypothetical protein